MKNIGLTKFSLFVLNLFLFISCVKLDEDLSGQPTTDKFFRNISDFKSFLAGAYNPLIAIYGTDYPYVAGAGAEDISTNVVRWRGFERVNINSVGNPDEITAHLWKNYYSCIGTCNTLLKIAATSTIAENELNPIRGEAYFLRAFSYFQLVRWFGEIPALSEKNQDNASFEEQSSIALIYDFIIEDLKTAETILPDKQEDRSKPDRYAAKALLAKVYLTAAGFPLNKTDYYALARDKAKEILDDGKINKHSYDLEPIFQNLWLYANRYTNKEFMFTLYASSLTGPGSYLHRAIRPWDHGEGGWGDWQSDKRFLNQYPKGNGDRLNGSFYLTMIDGTSWQNTDYAQPYVGKYRDAGPKSGGYSGAPLSNIADSFFPMIRYSDVLLIYAEAANLAENNPSIQSYQALNKVRKRAGLGEVSGLSKDQFDQLVLDERNWEFAFEINRWFDLCRRRLVKEKIGPWYPQSTIDDHNYLLPKPNEQLSIMKGLRQNPGY
ncbi:RagB/SusD family nutrient uptake outer membrane protein [Sphingobacterium spiritivorum]|uniref:RagB/SusD family nutrient uptake outer membrane protein n=1 Tax=Sphingobacterium spiritivorum TaxID=258 RepID=UPI003DA428E7